MTITVQAPNGASVDFPDGTPAETIHGVMTQHFGGGAPSLKSAEGGQAAMPVAPSPVWDVAKQAVVGPVVGAMALAGLPGTLANYGASNAEWLGDKFNDARGKPHWPALPDDIKAQNAKTLPFSGADIQGGVEKITGPFPEPETQAGRYARSIGEFVPGALTGGAGVARNVAKFAALPGAASEAAGELTGGNPLARAGAALATGGAASFFSRPRNAEAALSTAMQGLDKETIDTAHLVVRDAASRGIKLTMSQAISYVSEGSGMPMQQLQRFIERTSAGKAAMAKFYEGQPAAMRSAVESELGNIAPPPVSPYVVGPRAGEAARGAIEDTRMAINDVTRPLYERSRNAFIADAETNKPTFQTIWNEIKNDEILGPEPPTGVGSGLQNYPAHSIAAIDSVHQRGEELARGMRGLENPQNRKASIIERRTRDAVNAASRQNPDYAEALARQQSMRSDILEPMQRGPLGRVADVRDGTTEQAIDALFGSRLVGGERELGSAVTAMEAKQPGSAAALIRQHLAQLQNKSSADLVGGSNYYGGAKFAKAAAGEPQAAADLNAALQALPNGMATQKSLVELLGILKASGKRLPEGSATATDLGMADAIKASRGPVERTLSIAGRPFDALGRGVDDLYGRFRVNRTANALAEELTQPDIEMLRRIIGRREGGPGPGTVVNALRESLKPSKDTRPGFKN